MASDAAAAYRLNWNPEAAPDDVTEAHVAKCLSVGHVDFTWRCGNARITPGQRLFLMRTGKGPRGLIGIGWALGSPEGGDQDEQGEWISRWVPVRFNVLSLAPLVDREALESPPLDAVHWNSQTAAVRLTEEQADALEGLARPPNDKRGEAQALFGDAASNREVEQAAIAAVRKDYEARGWTVRSVERERIGFDLDCVRSGETEHVEVKGTSGVEVAFILTAGELDRSRTDPMFVLYVVTEARTESLLHRFAGQEVLSRFEFRSLQFAARLKPEAG